MSAEPACLEELRSNDPIAESNKISGNRIAIFLTVTIIGGVLSAEGLVGSLFSNNDAEWGDVIGEMKTYTVTSKISDLNIQINAAEFYIKEGVAVQYVTKSA